jgi:hypothetical protein
VTNEDPRPLSMQVAELRETMLQEGRLEGLEPITRKLAKLVHECLLEPPDAQWKVAARMTLARYQEFRRDG